MLNRGPAAERDTQPDPGIRILGVQFDGFVKIFNRQIDSATECLRKIIVPNAMAHVCHRRFGIQLNGFVH